MIKHNKPKYLPAYKQGDLKRPEPPPIKIPRRLSPLSLSKLLVYTSTFNDTFSFDRPRFLFDPQRHDFYEMEDDPYNMFPMYLLMQEAHMAADRFVQGWKIKKSKNIAFTRADVLRVLRSVEFSNLILGDKNYEEHLIGITPVMAGLFDAIDRVAAGDMPVLIMGETGTGKELVARAIWRKWVGKATNKPFLPINCAALPSEIIESELFGHKKGAFTGAIAEKQGIFEAAGEGVVFLDEIGEMPQLMQVKLLRALNERKFKRVGDTDEREFRARVIAATNRFLNDPEERENPKPGKPVFREDLYYRLAGASIRLPSLQERILDLPLLIYYYLKREPKAKPLDFLPQYLMHFIYHNWPGNIRELKNIINEAQLNSMSTMNPRDEISLSALLKAGGLEGTDFGNWLRVNIIKETIREYKKDYFQRLYSGDKPEITYLRYFFPEGAEAIDEEFIERFDLAIQDSIIASDRDKEALFQALLREWQHHRYQRRSNTSSKKFVTLFGITKDLEKQWVWEKYLTHPRGGGTGIIYGKWSGNYNQVDSKQHPLLRFGLFGISQLIDEEYESNTWPDLARRILNITNDANENSQEGLSKKNNSVDPQDALALMPDEHKEASRWFKSEWYFNEMKRRYPNEEEMYKKASMSRSTMTKNVRKRKENIP